MSPLHKALLFTLAAAAMAATGAKAASPPPPDAWVRAWQARRQADEARRLEIARASIALVARLKAGDADPVADARAAAARGRWGLIWFLSLGADGPPGVDCSMPSGFSASSLPIATVSVSDVPQVGEARALEQRGVDYAVAYNRTVAAQPGFAYRDLCVAGQPARTARLDLADPAAWPAPPPPSWTHTVDLGQAVRQGAREEVLRQIAAAGAGIDRRDDFGLTPLGWAVLRRRHDVVDLLLAAGADPLAGAESGPLLAAMPLKLAILMHDERSLNAFLTPQLATRLGSWPDALLNAATSAHWTELAMRMARERKAIEAARTPLCLDRPPPADTEVRLVTVYEAKAPVHIAIQARRKPLILALSAYEKVDWVIEAQPDSRLVAVLALGYARPRVTGAPAGVTVLVKDVIHRCEAVPQPSFFGNDPAALAQMTTQVEAMTGRKVTGVSAAYSGVDVTIAP